MMKKSMLVIPFALASLLLCGLPAFETSMAQAVYQELPAKITYMTATDNQTAIESDECPQCSAGTMGMISAEEAPPGVDFDSFFNAKEAPTEVNSGDSLYKRF